MKGLLLKDMYTILNNKRALLILLLVAVANGIFNRDGSGPIISTLTLGAGVMMMTYTTFAYDETANWDRYAICLPVSRQSIVLSKYLLLWASSLSVVILGTAFSAIVSLATASGRPIWASLMDSLLTVAIFLIVYQVTIPLVFKLGVEKTRLLNMAVIAVIMGLLVALFSIFGNNAWVLSHRMLVMCTLSLVPFILSFVSYRISVAIYAKKEF